MINLPNVLTLFRICLIPFLVILFYLPVTWGHTAAAALFALGSFTDWLDGYLARSLKQLTPLGAFLDPVADKLLVSVALVLIVGEQPQYEWMAKLSDFYTISIAAITIPAAIIVCREIVVSALREWMAEMGKRTSVAVSWLGKVKTTVQMISLIILLSCDPRSSALIVIPGYLLLYFSAVLTIWSMVLYLKAAWPEFQRQ